MATFPLVHSLNGFRLHQTAVDFESQTQFGDILGRERDRPVCFSIRCERWRTVFGWQLSTSAAPHTDASLSCHTRNVSKNVSRSASGRSPKPSTAAPTV